MKYHQVSETHMRGITCVNTHARLAFQNASLDFSKQGHMHSGRYCYTRIKIKLATAISFLPRAAGPICKHQTAALQKTCWFLLFKASSARFTNPNSISAPVFKQNAFSLAVANHILIHEAHFIEETV